MKNKHQIKNDADLYYELKSNVTFLFTLLSVVVFLIFLILQISSLLYKQDTLFNDPLFIASSVGLALTVAVFLLNAIVIPFYNKRKMLGHCKDYKNEEAHKIDTG